MKLLQFVVVFLIVWILGMTATMYVMATIGKGLSVRVNDHLYVVKVGGATK